MKISRLKHHEEAVEQKIQFKRKKKMLTIKLTFLFSNVFIFTYFYLLFFFSKLGKQDCSEANNGCIKMLLGDLGTPAASLQQ